jgi:hypothetical protein
MAYYLSLADMEGCRRVAARALERIDFRQEGEKLNIWTALLTMELKFGDGFEATIEKACQQNNPKQVYLRACELLEKDGTNADRTHAMYRENVQKVPIEEDCLGGALVLFAQTWSTPRSTCPAQARTSVVTSVQTCGNHVEIGTTGVRVWEQGARPHSV